MCRTELMNEVRQKSGVWINLVRPLLFGAAKAISSTVSVELLSNLTKTRHTVCRLNQITILVTGRNNLTVFKTTSIGSDLVKESRPPTSFRLARLALVLCHSCDDIGTPGLPNSTFYYNEGELKKKLFPFFLYNPFLTLKIWLRLEMATLQNPVFSPGAPNENIVQNHLNIVLLNVF